MKPLEWINGKLRFLDQTKLPIEEFYSETDDVEVVADAIKRLAIRGAPLIGIAAAYGVALASRPKKKYKADEIRIHITSAISLLASTRPTAANLFWALERQYRVLNEWQGGSILHLQKQLLDEAQRIHQEDAQMCERIASFGVELLSQACTILTHCNTGALATGGRGTALGIITKASELGKLKRVYINETRPLLQGARLTAWEMVNQQIPATLITDSTAAFLMQKGKIDAVIVGADRIAMNGDVANKIGTYNVAVLAKHHRIPFYVAAPISTIDFQISHGKEIPIEEREGGEIKYYGGIQISPGAIDVYSPAFDVTPNKFVTAIVTDQGIMVPPFIESLKKLPLRDFSAR